MHISVSCLNPFWKETGKGHVPAYKRPCAHAHIGGARAREEKMTGDTEEVLIPKRQLEWQSDGSQGPRGDRARRGSSWSACHMLPRG